METLQGLNQLGESRFAARGAERHQNRRTNQPHEHEYSRPDDEKSRRHEQEAEDQQAEIEFPDKGPVGQKDTEALGGNDRGHCGEYSKRRQIHDIARHHEHDMNQIIG